MKGQRQPLLAFASPGPECGRKIPPYRGETCVLILSHPPRKRRNLRAGRRSRVTGEATATAASLDKVEPASLATVDLISYLPDSLQLRYQAPSVGWLMITDRWAPGWKAEVNGKPEQVYGADFLFRAVKVEAGMNTITMRYQPRTWIASIVVSWGTLLFYLICEAVRIGRNKGLRHLWVAGL